MFTFLRKFFSNNQSYKTNQISFLIFGLGNRGKEYINTRHNIGFMVVDTMVSECSSNFHLQRCDTELFIQQISRQTNFLLAKPQTFVNRVGKPFKELQNNYKIPLNSCLAVVDDFNLPLGKIRFKRSGSDGGHNGLKSIISVVGKDFPRLKIGIGPLPEKIPIVEFVLGTFSDSENEKMKQIIPKSSKAVRYFCSNGIDAAMNKYNNN